MCFCPQALGEPVMNPYIYAYLAFGVLFGLATFGNRHLFSEGPTKSSDQNPSLFDGRGFWVSFCLFWWPVMLLTGLNTAFILAKRSRRSTIGSK